MHTRTPTLPGICHAAKFKTRLFVVGNDSPNLMLTKVSRYMVCMYCKYVRTHICTYVCIICMYIRTVHIQSIIDIIRM